MRVVGIVIMVMTLAVALCGCKKSADVSGGSPAGDLAFKLQSVDGSTFDASTLKGKVVVIEFWATWCPPCKMAIPDIQALVERTKGMDVAIVTVAVDDTIEPVAEFVKEQKLLYTVLHDDGSATKRFGVRGVPTTVLIDKSGKVVSTHMGYMSGYTDEMLAEIRKYI